MYTLLLLADYNGDVIVIKVGVHFGPKDRTDLATLVLRP